MDVITGTIAVTITVILGTATAVTVADVGAEAQQAAEQQLVYSNARSVYMSDLAAGRTTEAPPTPPVVTIPTEPAP